MRAITVYINQFKREIQKKTNNTKGREKGEDEDSVLSMLEIVKWIEEC